MIKPIFCCQCGARMNHVIPENDSRIRAACPRCGFIHYVNPLPICGTIPVWVDKVLLCRRAIEPQSGLWTLPAGYLECGESTSEGAARETWEEAGTKVEDLRLFMLVDVSFASQINLFFTARMTSPDFQPGPESLECRLFAESEIPWDSLAFRTVEATLKAFFEARKSGDFSVRHEVFAAPLHPLK